MVDFAILWLAAYLLEAPWIVQYWKSALINLNLKESIFYVLF